MLLSGSVPGAVCASASVATLLGGATKPHRYAGGRVDPEDEPSVEEPTPEIAQSGYVLPEKYHFVCEASEYNVCVFYMRCYLLIDDDEEPLWRPNNRDRCCTILELAFGRQQGAGPDTAR